MTAAACSVPLAQVAALNPRLLNALGDGTPVSFVPMASVSAEEARVTLPVDRPYAEVRKGYTYFETGDVLVAKITPCFENGKIAQALLPRQYGFGSTEFHVVRPTSGKLDGRYLHHFLRQARIRVEGERRMTGSGGQRRVPEDFLAHLSIPVPPLPDQRRIAALLDQADALRARRREALAQLDSLTQSIFIEMFGDPVTNSKRWPLVRFATKLSAPLRNGLSPSSVGKVQAKVLTLAAITGDDFDPSALKLGTFVSAPPAGQAVDERDFLICRGNGNMNLVGKGHFPDANMPDVTFPDTMIAARISRTEIGAAYLQTLWNSRAVRLQIEGLARTTNGTYKVNQPMLESVLIADPPLALQQTFATRIQAVESLKFTHRAALAELDALFASLQHRAFTG